MTLRLPRGELNRSGTFLAPLQLSRLEDANDAVLTVVAAFRDDLAFSHSLDGFGKQRFSGGPNIFGRGFVEDEQLIPDATNDVVPG